MRRPDAVTCNISRKELVFCEFPFTERKRLVMLRDCTNSTYILYHFILFKVFTVGQAVDRHHFISEARDRFPASPCGGFVVDGNFTGGVFSPRVFCCPSSVLSSQ